MNGSVKTYFLIFNPIGPPAITESYRAAQYWGGKGCTIETYQRLMPPTQEKKHAHNSCGTCCNHR
jgi:hypothetical protein